MASLDAVVGYRQEAALDEGLKRFAESFLDYHRVQSR